MAGCKFLFPFEMRRRYFYCTAFGLGRALHHMQQLNAAETGGSGGLGADHRELRVGRLQRQKVRRAEREREREGEIEELRPGGGEGLPSSPLIPLIELSSLFPRLTSASCPPSPPPPPPRAL